MNLLQKKAIFYLSLFMMQALFAQVPDCDTVLENDAVVEIHDNASITFFGNLNNGGTIETREDSNTVLKGNLENTGNFRINTNSPNTNGGTVAFENTMQPLSITGTSTPEFSTLVVNVTNNLSTQVPVDVQDQLLFQNGIVFTPRDSPDFPINLLNDALNFDSDNNKHIDGYTSYEGVLEHTFPIGDDNRLRTLSVETGASVNTTKAAYFYENAGAPINFPLSLDASERQDDISNISTFEFWDLDGNTSTRTTLTWDVLSNISQILNGAPLSELIVVGWSKDTQMWVNLGNTNTSGDLRTGQITSTIFNPDNFEALTFARNGSDDDNNPNQLTVFNGISSNNDNKNDYLAISNIRQFPNNTLQIFNRWGVKVYEADGYDAEPTDSPNFVEPTKAFRGKSNGRITLRKNDFLPVGTYYYILTYEVDGQRGEKTLAGYLYINR